jgi:hypothetical protein
MLGYDMLRQKLDSFEFFIAEVTFPNLFLSIFADFLSISDEFLDLLTNYTHILQGFDQTSKLAFCIFLYFLEDRLHVR